MDKKLLRKLRAKKFSGGGSEDRCPGRSTQNILEPRDRVREDKAQLELNLIGNIKDSKKDFYRNVESKRKTKDMWALPRRKQETCLSWTKRRLRF